MKYTTVLIDFDDTLIDTQGYAIKCLKDIYADHNISTYFPIYDDFIAIYMTHIHQLWELYALGKIDKQTLLNDRFNKTFESFPEVEKSYLDKMNKDFMDRAIKNDATLEGAKELLDYLKPKYKIVMISNGFSEMQYTKIENAGLSEYFDDIILSDTVGVNKPHPDIFTYALNKAKTTADKSIMIGDNILADIKGAINSNIDQIWYNPRNEKSNIKPTHTVDKLEQIIDIL